MKKRYIRLSGVVGMGAVLLAVAPLSADAEEHGFYFSADAGVSLAQPVDLKKFVTPLSGVEVKFDPGFRVGVAGGYNITDFIGVELETGYMYNSVKSVTGVGSIDASLSHIPMMANVVLRYDKPDCKWVPYGGAGAGGDVSVINLDQVDADGTIIDGTDSSIVFAWQAFAGVRYKLNDAMSIGAGYKFYSSSAASWDVSGFGSDSIKIGRANVHSITAAFNWKF